MGKTRSRIGRYSRSSRSKTTSTNSSRAAPKRPRIVTPNKTLLKSPFRSPLYKASPVYKKFKLSRKLFNSNTIASSIAENSWNLDQSLDELKVLSNSTISADEFVPLVLTSENNPLIIDNGINTQIVVETPASANETETTVNKMIEMLPSVMESLKKEGLDTMMEDFFQLVEQDKFPLNNIALLLWSEVVKWYKTSSTTRMRYSENTKMFWKLGWRIFGKRFVNFMGGFKSHGETLLQNTSRGNYSPVSSEINFAVPDVNVLRDFNPFDIDVERNPGVFLDTIEFLSKNMENKSACLTFDGKKLKQGLTSDSGDVDLLGYEKGTTLKERAL